ncbi:MAG: hypothetical protein IPK53_07925 [bacterium]|nr:hypothetical protein [bacterium]
MWHKWRFGGQLFPVKNLRFFKPLLRKAYRPDLQQYYAQAIYHFWEHQRLFAPAIQWGRWPQFFAATEPVTHRRPTDGFSLLGDTLSALSLCAAYEPHVQRVKGLLVTVAYVAIGKMSVSTRRSLDTATQLRQCQFPRQ